LRERGCTAVQGFYFSQAVPATQLLDFMRTNNFANLCAH
jgi:EAL domain-containing protein (putative c-di-GMP-specific phosphodiesterase class I)